MKRFLVTAASAFALAALPAYGAIVVDGTAEGAYGAPLSIQNTSTSFGNSNLGQVDYANGSELDAAYARVQSGVLYLTLAGNLESNFNKLEVFVDSIAGGQNTLRGDNPNVDFDGLNRMSGMTFDAGCSPDFWFSVTGGGGPYALYANYAELLTAGGGQGYYLGTTGAASNGALSGGNNPNGILVTINNSNTAGVGGGTGPDSGAGVFTGVEFAIPLGAIGSPTGDFRIVAMINGGGHDFLSNQVLGGIGGGDHLGDPHNVNFNNVPGDQSVLVPEPASLAGLLLGLGLLARRR